MRTENEIRARMNTIQLCLASTIYGTNQEALKAEFKTLQWVLGVRT